MDSLEENLPSLENTDSLENSDSLENRVVESCDLHVSESKVKGRKVQARK